MMRAFDHQMRRLGFSGNQAQIVLGLDSRLSASALEHRLREICFRFPLLDARVSGGPLHLFPCWQVRPGRDRSYPRVVRHAAGDADTLARTREEILNRPLDTRNGELVRFDRIHKSGAGTELILTWSHMLMDVHGAQYLLGIIGGSVPGADRYSQNQLLSGSYTERMPPGSKWEQAKKAFAHVDRLAARPPVSLYNRARQTVSSRFSFRITSFTKQQTQKILERAQRQGGLLNESAYYMAAGLGEFHRFMQARQISATGYVVPVSVDLRKKGARLPVFTNQAATLLCGFLPEQLREFDAILSSFKQQARAAVRRDLITANTFAMELARFIPARMYAAKMRKAFSGEIASVVFANPGAGPEFLYEFMGHSVGFLHHVPTVVVPPGMGLVFYTFAGRLHITLVYVASLLEPREADALLTAVGTHLEAGQLA